MNGGRSSISCPFSFGGNLWRKNVGIGRNWTNLRKKFSRSLVLHAAETDEVLTGLNWKNYQPSSDSEKKKFGFLWRKGWFRTRIPTWVEQSTDIREDNQIDFNRNHTKRFPKSLGFQFASVPQLGTETWVAKMAFLSLDPSNFKAWRHIHQANVRTTKSIQNGKIVNTVNA